MPLWSPWQPLKACRCTPDQVARYQSRLSGPCWIASTCKLKWMVPLRCCREARMGSLLRSSPSAWRGLGGVSVNISLPERRFEPVGAACRRRFCRPDFLAAGLHASPGGSGRAFPLLKLARTMADLAEAERVSSTHIASHSVPPRHSASVTHRGVCRFGLNWTSVTRGIGASVFERKRQCKVRHRVRLVALSLMVLCGLDGVAHAQA